jgi:hypothetical protein
MGTIAPGYASGSLAVKGDPVVGRRAGCTEADPFEVTNKVTKGKKVDPFGMANKVTKMTKIKRIRSGRQTGGGAGSGEKADP